MSMLRSRRLENVFGGELGAVTAAQVRSLVEGQVEESFDLDFKAQLYGAGDADKRALCGDVAALANTAGGVVLLGVAEDDQSRASATPGVGVSDAEVARIRQIVAAGVSPMPLFDVVRVLDDGDPGHGFLLIEVPRSVLAPHAVLIGESLRFPMRNGATTRYLSEPEVAAAYRTRLAGQSERAGRTARIEADMLSRLDLVDDPWIVVSLVPDLPGDFVINRATFAAFEEDIRETRLAFLDGDTSGFSHAGVGYNRFRADDAFRDDHPLPHYRAVEIHADGAGSAAMRLFDLGAPTRAITPTQYTVSDESLATALIGSLQCLALNATNRAHASGMAALRASLFVAPHARQTSVGSRRSGFVRADARTIEDAIEPVEAFASLDELAAASQGLVAAAARLHHSLGQAFGIPELPQLTLDGQFVWPFWDQGRRPYVEAWASDHGVEIVGKPEPS